MIFNTIGLAYAAKKVTLGTDNIIAGLKSKQVKLVIISNNASFNTQKVMQDKAKFYNVDVVFVEDNGRLSKAIGKENIKVVGIKDQGFKKLIIGA